MTSVKLAFRDEVRLCSIGVEGQSLKLDEVIDKAKTIFAALRDAAVVFKWKDSEGDTITIREECELAAAVRVAQSAAHTLRLACHFEDRRELRLIEGAAAGKPWFVG